MISVYSTLSAVLFFNISMLAVYLLRRKNGFLAAYTAPVLRFLTLLGAVRLFLPLDVEKAWVIALPELLPFLHERLHIPLVPGVLSLGGALAGAGLALNGIDCRQKSPAWIFLQTERAGKVLLTLPARCFLLFAAGEEYHLTLFRDPAQQLHGLRKTGLV